MAVRQYKKALEIDPDNLYALYDIGYVHKESGRYKEAIKAYERVLEIDPAYPYALWDIGEVYEKMGMKEKAEEQFRHYHEMTGCSFRRIWNCLD
jgi:tetratricopeptide (TPR) repeat protein